jgi:hypothetical protein
MLASDNLDWLSRLQKDTKKSKCFSFLRKNFKKNWMFKKKALNLHTRYEDSRIRQSESNDNRTRRHPVDLLAGHLL